MKIYLLIVAVLLLVGASAWGQKRRSFHYGDSVELNGTLKIENHEEWKAMTPDLSKEELAKRVNTPAYILLLEQPIAVSPAKGDSDEPEANVTEVYLMDDSETLRQALKGKRLSITGVLGHANTIHHLRPVMLDVSSVSE